MRKAISLVAILCTLCQLSDWRQSKHNIKTFKRLFRKAQQLKRSTSKDENKKVVVQKPIEKKKRSQLSYMEKKELEQLPEKMEVLESEMEALDHQMNECQSDFAKLKELSDLRTQKEEELETLTNRWMELEEKKEG